MRVVQNDKRVVRNDGELTAPGRAMAGNRGDVLDLKGTMG
jgi:hypothetical protein